MIGQIDIELPALGRGFHLITDHIVHSITDLPDIGIMHLHILHTSAGLTINENADPSVLVDYESFFNHIVPERMSFITHDMEGDDDMPAHIKASLVGNSISVPIRKGKLLLGTWQGIYLCEFRNHPHRRKLVISIY
ncbi:MAG: secondary thiamine-phosphate synthase enzyme [Saprospiraceae bacterium]|jgi:secondary thiamine-phosphate synthase enzyme